MDNLRGSTYQMGVKPVLKIAVILTSLAPLTGCGAERVDAQIEQEVRDYFIGEEHPTPVAKLWKAHLLKEAMVCGRMEPMPDGTRHRFYYYHDRSRHYGQVEMNDVIAFSSISDALVAQNRQLFDKLWKDNCADGESVFSIF